MKHVFLSSIFVFAFVFNAFAQNKKEKDQQAIKKMCGCYEVGFNFAETFQYSDDPNYVASKVKHDRGLEWVQLVEDDTNKIVLQHLLIVGKPEAQRVIKHWRQDWIFENTALYMYHVNNTWKYTSLPKNEVQGQWTQKVFQVDDSPRYEGTASWIHVDGQSSWENATDAPLPRREYTKRSDYNVTYRNNKHAITSEGWIHDQDNKKIIRKEGEADIILAEEKGLNTYIKVDDIRCKAAQDWWRENNQDWALVRAKWDLVFAQKQDLRLNAKVDDKPLYAYLFDKDFVKTEENVTKTIDRFIAK